jgi:transcriptional regulator with XRE-family HTH domain
MTFMGQINPRSRTGFLHGEPTRKLSLEGGAASFKGEREAVLVSNLSSTGMLLETDAILSVGEPLQLLLSGGDACTATIVWSSENIFACTFENRLPLATISKIKLQNPRDARVNEGNGFRRIEEIPEETLGERIRRLRRARGLGMAHFASCIGVSKPTLWKWEKGTVSPRQQMTKVIARELGVHEKELIYGSSRQVAQREHMPATASDAPAEEIAKKKEELAHLFGVPPSRIKIMIEA